MDEKGGIGKHNRLPWHVASDLKRFKRLTMGHHVVMGRKTYQAIGKPLPGRIMVVVSRQKDFLAAGCQVVQSLGEALKTAEDHQESEVFIIGGGDIYQQSVDLADKIYLTTVRADVRADISFPSINLDQWEQIDHQLQQRDNQNDYASDFTVLQRKTKSHLDP
jgi:dihydrofolate reductase